MATPIRHKWPRSKTAIKIVDRGPMDEDGRCSFAVLWWQDGVKRAQCFHAKPDDIRRMVLRNLKWNLEQQQTCSKKIK